MSEKVIELNICIVSDHPKDEDEIVDAIFKAILEINEGYNIIVSPTNQDLDVLFDKWIKENDYWYQYNDIKTMNDKELLTIPVGLWYKHGMSVGGIKTSDLIKEYRLSNHLNIEL
jgi:hypothetical protein